MGRIGGGIVLLVAVLVLLIVPRVLESGIGGVAVRAPAPGPPAPGACLLFDSTITGGDGQLPAALPEFEMVPCDQPHDVEVAAVFAAQDWQATAPGEPEDPCRPPPDSYRAVADFVYFGHWYLPSTFLTITLVRAPLSESIGENGWRACVINPSAGSRYTGQLFGLTDIRDRPSAFGSCGLIIAQKEATVACDQPHQSELLTSATGFVPDDPQIPVSGPRLPDQATLSAECEKIAADLLSRDDPTFEGRMLITLGYETRPGEVWTDSDGDTMFIESELVPGILVTASCGVSVVGEAKLTDSLVGIGDDPLPVRE